MAMDVSRVSTAANNDFFDNTLKPALDAANIPAAQQTELKAQNLALITAICNAIVTEIKDHAQVKTKGAVDSIITAIGAGVPIAMDGGAGLKATIVAALPATVSESIE